MKNNMIYNSIIEILSKIKEIDNVILDENTNLLNIGLSSLQIVNFLLKVENEFDIDLDFEEFNYEVLNSITEFVEFLETNYVIDN